MGSVERNPIHESCLLKQEILDDDDEEEEEEEEEETHKIDVNFAQ